jgi:DNA phosphorothioation-associated putative methyltransferase
VHIARHRTALHRVELSRPVRLAVIDKLIAEGVRVFDYGCGRGEDLRQLRKRGIECEGWDPVHLPSGPRAAADVVNLGYVVNVIESEHERREVLGEAWRLANRVLVVSARLKDELRDAAHEEYADGVVTRRGTFQRYFEQTELRSWIDRTLEARSVPAAPGIFYVFRDEAEREAFVAARYRRRIAMPRLRQSEVLFEQHRALLEPLMAFVSDRGRLPEDDEVPGADALVSIFCSIKRAFTVVRRVTGEEAWTQVREQRALELLVYLALARFDGRQQFSRLPVALRRDVRAFFGPYTEACAAADEFLFAVGEPGTIDAACRASEIGKLTPTALYVHESALGALSPLLRIYEGCARGYIGAVEGANIIKLNRAKPKISYLSYPDFERDPHPALAFSLGVNLQTFGLKARKYTQYRNPPILHRKETFVTPDHPLHDMFRRLTRIEEQKGLFDETSAIGTRDGWVTVLGRHGVYLKGHRLLARPGAQGK